MQFNLSDFWYLGGIPLVIGIVQIFKLWITDTRWYPVIAIIFGIILDVGIGLAILEPLAASIVAGIIVGLAASGLYSGGSTLAEGKLADKKNRAIAAPVSPPITPQQK